MASTVYPALGSLAMARQAAGLVPIWRSRQAGVVGDPLQLEPILSLPASAVKTLRGHLEDCPPTGGPMAAPGRASPIAEHGKEADAAIPVLGGSIHRDGALDGAASRPNLLNVAVTRARRRLYVVGNRGRWKSRPYFSELAWFLPPVETG